VGYLPLLPPTLQRRGPAPPPAGFTCAPADLLHAIYLTCRLSHIPLNNTWKCWEHLLECISTMDILTGLRACACTAGSTSLPRCTCLPWVFTLGGLTCLPALTACYTDSISNLEVLPYNKPLNLWIRSYINILILTLYRYCRKSLCGLLYICTLYH